MQNNQSHSVKDLAWLQSELGALLQQNLSDNLVGSDLPNKINDLNLDSRRVKAGDVFIALSGFNVHGLEFAIEAEKAGAIAVVVESVESMSEDSKKCLKLLSIPVIKCNDLSAVLGELASAFYDRPSQKMHVTAITGTNGKTSTAWLLMYALEQLGVKVGYMGTLGIGGISGLKKTANTTPSAIVIQKNLAAMISAGYEHVCMEVSSHALDQKRLNGTEIQSAVFTNLTRDHLDYHHTMQAYADAKLKLFKDFAPSISVINGDDEVGASWLDRELFNQSTVSYGVKNKSVHFKASNIKLLTSGITFELDLAGKSFVLNTSLLGAFNVENTLAVIAILEALGYPINQISSAVARLQPVPGRMNRVDDVPNDVLVVVDYAHTPDALLQVLKSLRAHALNCLWCVFGCGGNRDKGKRSIMGEIAEQHADQVVLTDDNPRFESSIQIISDIKKGMKNEPHVINNRKQAIAYVLNNSKSGDVVLLAGKGHESTQEINGKLIPFNDTNVVKQLIKVAV